jgi:hypothetical protein
MTSNAETTLPLRAASAMLFAVVTVAAFTIPLFAHAGRTDKNGCHEDSKTGQVHCHETALAAAPPKSTSSGAAKTSPPAKQRSATAAGATTAPADAGVVAMPVYPQVYIDQNANVFHEPDCKRITPAMTMRSRSVAVMQHVAPSAECAVSTAEAAKRWEARRMKAGVKPGQGLGRVTDFGQSTLAADAPSSPVTTRSDSQKRQASGTPAGPTRNEVMAASDFYSAKDVIRRKCAAEWPNDPQMMNYCTAKQESAVTTLQAGRPFGADEATWNQKRVDCASKWPNDYTMRVYCESH